MILTRRFFAAAAALMLVAPAGAAPQKKAADWSRTVVATPDGGFRMGNPKAKVKLVEYGSLTCGHCRHFAETGVPPLMKYVKSGKVSFEYRSFVLNGIDVSATLVARCAGASRFFPVVEKLFAAQQDWIAKISGLPDDEKNRIGSLPNDQRVIAIASAAGIQNLAAASGLPTAEANKCLADKAGLERIGKIYENGVALGVEGTPTFFVNGAKVKASDWPSLEPFIKSAGG